MPFPESPIAIPIISWQARKAEIIAARQRIGLLLQPEDRVEDIAAGKEWHVELRLNPDQPVPKAIRVWVGTENGRGSVKAKAEAEKDAKGEYGAHVEVPNPIPADSKLWISIEPENGQSAKGALALPAAK